MKIKKVKELLNRTFTKGVYSGLDITKGERDEFFGNQEARRNAEERFLEETYLGLKKLVEER